MSIADDDLFPDPADEAPGRSRRSGGGGRGPRQGGGGSGGSPLQQPRVRALIALGLLVVVVLILISTVRGCQRDKLVDSYRGYLTSANTIATESETQGRQLQKLLDNEQLNKRAAIVAEVQKLATSSSALVERANDLNPPDALSSPHRTFVTALEYRAEGLRQLPDAINTAVPANEATVAATTMAAPLQVLAASDVIYRQSYKLPADNAIAKDKIKEIQPVKSEFFPGTTYNKTSPEGALKVVAAIKQARRPNPVTGGTATPGGLHGLSISSVFAVRADGKRTQLIPGTTVQLQPNGTTFEVSIENGGDSNEAGIEVTFTYTSPSNEVGTPQKQPIDEISPGQTNRQTVTFELGSPAYLLGASTINVQVSEVPDEKTKENNKATYPVEFSLQ